MNETQGAAFSAIITTYNRADLLAGAIRSVQAQSHPAAEIIVVDDGSTDNTREVVGAFGAAVRYVYQENAGVSAARNTGADAARSPWLAFFDDDDRWHETYLERVAAAIAATDGAANFYFADTLLDPVFGDDLLFKTAGLAVPGDHLLADDATEWVMNRTQPMRVQSAVFKREAYFDLGGSHEDLRVRTDTYLFLNLGLEQPACAVAGIGAEMSDAAGNRLTARDGVWNRSYLDVYRRVLENRGDLSPPLRDRLKRRIAEAYFGMAVGQWRRRQPVKSARYLFRSASTSPRWWTQRLTRRIGS